MVPYLRAEGWPAVLTGAVFSATPLGYGLGTLVGGRLADRRPPRRLCWAGLALLAAGLGVAFAVPAGLTFVVCYAFLGLGVGGGLALTGTVAALVQVFPERTGAVGGGASAVYATAAVFQAPLIAGLAPALGWLGALRAVGAGMVLLAAALLAFMPALPARGRPGAGGVRGLLARPAVWSGCVLAMCGAVLGSFATVDLAAEVIARSLGAALATGALVAFATANALGRLLAGVAADRIGAAGVVALVLLLDLGAGALLFGGVVLATALIAALAAGGALGGSAGVLARVGADAAPEAPNGAFGLLFTGFTVGAFGGPILGGLTGAPAAWLVTAAPAGAGLALLAARQLSAGAGGPGPARRR